MRSFIFIQLLNPLEDCRRAGGYPSWHWVKTGLDMLLVHCTADIAAIHSHIHTHTGLWKVGGRQITGRQPTQSGGEHANLKQRNKLMFSLVVTNKVKHKGENFLCTVAELSFSVLRTLLLKVFLATWKNNHLWPV